MNNNDKNTGVADKVLAYIEKENVQPRSKWYFVFTNDFFWVLGALSVVMGALSFAVILFTYFNAEPELYRVDYDSFFNFIFEWIPILWMASFALFTYIGYKNIQYTKHGYRYSFSLIVLGSLVLSFIGGVVIYSFGLAGTIDSEFERRLPMYRSVHGLKRDIILRPQRGTIGGEVVSIAPDFSSFVVQDFKGSMWIVSTQELLEQDRNVVAEFSFVRVIGVPATSTVGSLATSTMYGCAVLPWKIEQEEKKGFTPKIQAKMVRRVISERKESFERSSICKGVQPYLIIQEIRNKKNQ